MARYIDADVLLANNGLAGMDKHNDSGELNRSALASIPLYEIKRMIDADEIHDLTKVFSDKENGNVHFIYGIETAVEFADGLPTVDAELVRHGHWTSGRFPNQVICSVCGDWSIAATRYCPHCGAKMEEKIWAHHR